MVLEREPADEYKRAYQIPEVARRYDGEMGLNGPRSWSALRNLVGRIVIRAERKAIARLLSRLPKGGTILDVPCGSGKELPVLARRGRVIGADSSTPMLKLYARRGGPESLCADIRLLPFKSQSIDVIVCNRFLHRLPPVSRAKVLAELHRVSKQWALTYHGIDGLGQKLVITFERAFGFGPRGRMFLSSPSLIRRELETLGWKVLAGRAIMTGVSTGYVCVLEKISDG